MSVGSRLALVLAAATFAGPAHGDPPQAAPAAAREPPRTEAKPRSSGKAAGTASKDVRAGPKVWTVPASKPDPVWSSDEPVGQVKGRCGG